MQRKRKERNCSAALPDAEWCDTTGAPQPYCSRLQNLCFCLLCLFPVLLTPEFQKSNFKFIYGIYSRYQSWFDY